MRLKFSDQSRERTQRADRDRLRKIERHRDRIGFGERDERRTHGLSLPAARASPSKGLTGAAGAIDVYDQAAEVTGSNVAVYSVRFPFFGIGA